MEEIEINWSIPVTFTSEGKVTVSLVGEDICISQYSKETICFPMSKAAGICKAIMELVKE